jgi:hypothetical protein
MHGKTQCQQFEAGRVGEADLLYRDGHYYLAISVKMPDPPALETTDGALGVDLGIVELATDSLRHAYSGEEVKAVRTRPAPALGAEPDLILQSPEKLGLTPPDDPFSVTRRQGNLDGIDLHGKTSETGHAEINPLSDPLQETLFGH